MSYLFALSLGFAGLGIALFADGIPRNVRPVDTPAEGLLLLLLCEGLAGLFAVLGIVAYWL